MSKALAMILVAVCVSALHAEDQKAERLAAEAAARAEKKSDTQLITALGADHYFDRVAATNELIRRGRQSVLTVVNATWSRRPETRHRCENILAALERANPYPSNEAIAAGLNVCASNSRFWAGYNPTLMRADESMDCNLSITSTHLVQTSEYPIQATSGKGDDGSFVTSQIWSRSETSVSSTSFSAPLYLTRPGAGATTVHANIVLNLRLTPVEVLTIADLAPENGRIVYREDYTWAENVRVEKDKDGKLHLKFRLYDLAGRICRDGRIEFVDTDDVTCVTLSRLKVPTRFSADYSIELPHGKPKEIRLEMRCFEERHVLVPLTVEVAVPKG